MAPRYLNKDNTGLSYNQSIDCFATALTVQNSITSVDRLTCNWLGYWKTMDHRADISHFLRLIVQPHNRNNGQPDVSVLTHQATLKNTTSILHRHGNDAVGIVQPPQHWICLRNWNNGSREKSAVIECLSLFSSAHQTCTVVQWSRVWPRTTYVCGRPTDHPHTGN